VTKRRAVACPDKSGRDREKAVMTALLIAWQNQRGKNPALSSRRHENLCKENDNDLLIYDR